MAWVLILVLGLAPPFLREAHTDIAWPFYLAEQMLQGARQGIDFLEVNPPLFLWLAIPPVLLERITGLGAWQWNVALTALLAAAALAMSNRILPQLIADQRERRVLLLVAGFAALVLPGVSFSQREHLAYLAVLPYVVLSASRLGGMTVPTRSALVVGVLGGLGFALKPHFLLAWLLIEALLSSRLGGRAIRRPEVGALIVFGVLYLLAVLLFVPDYLSMAIRLRPLYDQYLNNGIALTTVDAGPVLLVTALVALGQRAAAPRRDPIAASLRMSFFGFLAAAILQRKGFDYHFVAASAFGLLWLVRGRQVLDPGLRVRVSSLMPHAMALIACIVLVHGSADAVRQLSASGANTDRGDPTYPRLLPVVKQLAGGQPFLILSTNPALGWPLTREANAIWASRYMSFWPLAALHDRELWSSPFRILRAPTGGPDSQFEIEFRNEVVEDLHRWQPRLIIVPVPDSTVAEAGGAFRIDYLDYFSADLRFRDFMRDFSPADTIGPYVLMLRRER